ncbi:MAG: HAMP domain-containing protein [Desulfomonile tiedjei]|uniref:HAMP domain-containing protein n=1 Tax=Desulfomonile tiedjei TaxID=2358 RepID=A0A9D6Z1W4_9BACT|nr:HAMP domain-containing protein [Desulfomonile tiedjei]
MAHKPYSSDRRPEDFFGDADLKCRTRKWTLLSPLIAVAFNILGATLTFIYFAFIEGGLENSIVYEDAVEKTWFFLLRMGIICTAVTLLGIRLLSPIRRKLERESNASLESVLGDLVNLPAYMAGLSLAGWAAAAFVFGVFPEFSDKFRAGPWHIGMHSLIGIVFVGGPFTVVSVYLVLEGALSKLIQRIFPVEHLLGVPRSFRISVRLKTGLVSLLIGTIPVSVVSYITLRQICEIQAGRQDIGTFVSNMPIAIGFLLFLAVSGTMVLSFLVSRSVSLPLTKAGYAMKKISRGNLDVGIPVLSNDEIGVMLGGLNRMVEGLRERDFIRDTFGSYLNPDVVTQILQSPEGLNLGGELRQVTILVSDLRGFTSFTANMRPEVLLKLVNLYLEKMVDVIISHGGIIDEFTGDGILAFFGAPHDLPRSQVAAVKCALEMQSRMPELNRELSQLIPEIRGSDGNEIRLAMGIAVNSGKLVVGNIGCEKRKKYGAVGVAINLAFRVEKETAGGDVLVTQPVYEEVGNMVNTETISDVALKGIEGTVTLYRVLGLKD